MYSLSGVFQTIPVVQIDDSTFFQKMLIVIAVGVIGYILGSLCFAIIFTRLFIKKDIRKLGSGNAGTANVIRNVGIIPGILTGIFDFAKGVASVYIGFILFQMVGFEIYSGGCFATIFVLLGHFYPVFFNYRGGKGVMTLGGIIAMLHLKLFVILAAIYFTVLFVAKMTSLAALVTFSVLPAANIVFCIVEGNSWITSTLFYLCITVLIFYTHRENIKRLKDGTEPKLFKTKK